MKSFFRQFYLTNLFFYFLGGIAVSFAVSYWLEFLFLITQASFVLLLAICVVDGLLLFSRPLRPMVRRKLPRALSLGDETEIEITIVNRSGQELNFTLIDELPVQLQERDFYRKGKLPVGGKVEANYSIRPLERGAYEFGNVLLYFSTNIGLLERRYEAHLAKELPVYPSIIQMKQFELRAFDRMSHLGGIKQLRRIGHSYEFDQIKNYVRGDDYRSVNWKATSRQGKLMVNQYEDERAQQVYCLIDKSRSMLMPFGGLSLLDYAINTSLVVSNIALKKHDRAGLITFSDKLGSILKADSKPTQLNKILQSLYKEQERGMEANYELLYYFSRKLISGRSLLLLYTNFESMYALDRVLPILRRVNAFHLLVVIFFENTEIRDFVEQPATTVEDIYQQTVARKFLAEKSAMVQKLRQYGIQAVLSKPEDLSMNTINKYLELKARGLI